MKNWTQQIIPLIKDSRNPLTPRLDACMPFLKEALIGSHNRNLAGEMFRSLNEYKYAKEFMLALGGHVKLKLSPADAKKCLDLTPEVDYPEMYNELSQLRALSSAYAGNTDKPYQDAMDILIGLGKKSPDLAARAFTVLHKFSPFGGDGFKNSLLMYIENNAPNNEAGMILSYHQQEQSNQKRGPRP